MQGDPGIPHVHSGFWIGGNRGAKRFDEARPEMPQLSEPGPELGVDRWPGNRRRLGQRVEPPRELDIDIQAHRAIS